MLNLTAKSGTVITSCFWFIGIHKLSERLNKVSCGDLVITTVTNYLGRNCIEVDRSFANIFTIHTSSLAIVVSVLERNHGDLDDPQLLILTCSGQLGWTIRQFVSLVSKPDRLY